MVTFRLSIRRWFWARFGLDFWQPTYFVLYFVLIRLLGFCYFWQFSSTVWFITSFLSRVGRYITSFVWFIYLFYTISHTIKIFSKFPSTVLEDVTLIFFLLVHFKLDLIHYEECYRLHVTRANDQIKIAWPFYHLTFITISWY